VSFRGAALIRSAWRIRWLRGAIALALLVAASPVLLLIAFGLWRGYDVPAGLYGLAFPYRSGTTIDPARVPYVGPLRVEWLGELESLDLSEASGLAPSNRRDDLFWSENDSGNPHELFAIDARGRDLGRVQVDDSVFGDWEDVTSFRLDDRPYLLIADTGDNLRWRPELQLIAVEEPAVAGTIAANATARPAWVVRFRYPDGMHDCEAVAVDEARERIVLVTKRDIPALVYELPLRAAADGAVQVAERVGALDTIPQPVERDRLEDADLGGYRSQPTAASIAGDRLVIVTYKDAYLYSRAAGESFGAAVRRVPARIALPQGPGREAGALSRDGRFLYVTAERGARGDAGVYRVDLAGLPAGSAAALE
jgi:hypothetical protein